MRVHLHFNVLPRLEDAINTVLITEGFVGR